MFYDPDSNLLVYDQPALASVEGAIELDGSYVAFRATLTNLQRLHRLEQVVPAPLEHAYDWPGPADEPPFEAQKVTANFLVLNPHACCFNDTGTGKTRAALWAADYIMRLYEAAGKRIRALIVCPKSCMDAVWKDQVFKAFWSRRTVSVAHGTASKRNKMLAADVDFYIVNFDGLLVKDFAAELALRDDIQIIIVDEASAYRHANTPRHRKTRTLLGERIYLWPMTATPCSNGPTDAYGIAKLVNNAGGESFRSFQERVTFSAGPWKRVPRIGAHEDALKLMSPAIRFAIGDCLDLPECTVQRREVELSPEQKHAYERLRLDAQLMLKDGARIDVANQAVLRSKLIQVVCGAIYDSEHAYHEIDATPRHSALKEIIDSCREKVIVFAPLRSAVEILYKKFSKLYACEMIHGDITGKHRAQIFSRFEREDRDNLQVIVADPGTMAHGITLVAGTIVAWYGPTDKTEHYLHGNKRIHRPGQTKTTTVVQMTSTPVEHEIYRRAAANETMLGAILKLVEDGRK